MHPPQAAASISCLGMKAGQHCLINMRDLVELLTVSGGVLRVEEAPYVDAIELRPGNREELKYCLSAARKWF